MNLRECSVRLWRCDLAGREGATRPSRGGPVPYRGPRSAAVAVRAEHVQEGCKTSLSPIKVKADCEGAVEYTSVVKMEVDKDQIAIKEELDIGPTVLQWRASPLDVCSAESVGFHGRAAERRAHDSLDPHRSIDFGSGTTAAPLDTSFSYPAPQTSLEGCCVKYSGVPVNTSLVPTFSGEHDTGHRALKEQSLDHAGGEGTCANTLEFANKQHERDCLEFSASGDTTSATMGCSQ